MQADFLGPVCPVSTTSPSLLPTSQHLKLRLQLPVCLTVSLHPPQIMQGLAWVVATVLLKFILSAILSASDDVSLSLFEIQTSSHIQFE